MSSLQPLSLLKGKIIEKNGTTELVHQVFTNNQENYANRVAIFFDDDTGNEYRVLYQELEDLTNKIARALKQIVGLSENGDLIIAVSMKPSHYLPITLLSILKSGMAYLPLDVDFPASRVEHILTESEPLLVIIDEGDESIYGGTPTVTYSELWEKSKSESPEPLEYGERPDGDLMAIVLYTSGSTGIPKGVRVSHAALLNRLHWEWRELPYLDDEDHCIFKTVLTFIDSAPEIWGPLLRGKTIVVVPKHVTRDPERFITTLEKHKIRRLVLVPSLLQSILLYLDLQADSHSLQHLKLWISSGETLFPALAKQFFNRFSEFGHTLANVYGSTEAIDVTFHLLKKASQLENMKKIPIGRPSDNCIIYVINQELGVLPQDEVGELVVAGRSLAAGYIRGRDSYRFSNNPYAVDPMYPTVYHTGDYARIINGTVIYEGRIDSQIKIRGHRVDLAEVKKSIVSVPAVNKTVVLCYKPGKLSQALIAFVTAKEGNSVSSLEIEDYLQSKLLSYMIPQVVVIDNIPLLINGKTDRDKLLKIYESLNLQNENDEAINCDYTGVSDTLQGRAKVLFPTVASVIGKNCRSSVNLNSNFYELGGNSLNSIYTVTKLQDQGYQVGISNFLIARNMKEILEMMIVCPTNVEIEDTSRKSKFLIEPLKYSDVARIVANSLSTKGPLQRWLAPGSKQCDDCYDLVDAPWDFLVEKSFSFVVKSADSDKKILGATFNFDIWNEPVYDSKSKHSVIGEFLKYLEYPIKEKKLPRGKGKVLHSVWMTTHTDLNPAENVMVVDAMENECLSLARRKGFEGIFTTNTSLLTQQLDIDVYGYEVLLDYQVNKYVASDGSKPFGLAPDDQRAICCWKKIQGFKK